jgi:hypothetical protein
LLTLWRLIIQNLFIAVISAELMVFSCYQPIIYLKSRSKKKYNKTLVSAISLLLETKVFFYLLQLSPGSSLSFTEIVRIVPPSYSINFHKPLLYIITNFLRLFKNKMPHDYNTRTFLALAINANDPLLEKRIQHLIYIKLNSRLLYALISSWIYASI